MLGIKKQQSTRTNDFCGTSSAHLFMRVGHTRMNGH